MDAAATSHTVSEPNPAPSPAPVAESGSPAPVLLGTHTALRLIRAAQPGG